MFKSKESAGGIAPAGFLVKVKQLRIDFVFFSLFCAALSACTKVPSSGEREVAETIQSKIGMEVYWNRHCLEKEEAQSYVEKLFEQPLTAGSAVQIALLNNPAIQEIFEELGIAQADLLAAGLLSNPAFELEVRYPQDRRLHLNIEYLVTAAFLDIFFIPLRMKVASAEWEQAKAKVAQAVLDLSWQVRETFYDWMAEQQQLHLVWALAELDSLVHEIYQKQLAVGNLNPLAVQQAQLKTLETKVEVQKSQARLIQLQESLFRLLGLHQETCLNKLEGLPDETGYQGFDLCLLESVALSERLDLQAVRFEILRLFRQLGLNHGWAYTNLQAGLAGERDADGVVLNGYGLKGDIPIFNHGQAVRMRLKAQLRQAQDKCDALKILILSEVRQAHCLLMNQIEILQNYYLNILPLRRKTVQEAEELYHVMGLGIDQLLQMKRQAIETDRQYLENLKGYWIARVQLDRALGGHLFRLLAYQSKEE